MGRLTRIFCIFFLASTLAAQNGDTPIYRTNPNYEQGDWITYSVNRYITTIVMGQQYVYFGTTGGITRYDHWQNMWDFPFTVSSGLADNHVTALGFDKNTSILWAATETAISYYTPSSQQWQNYITPEISNNPVIAIGFSTEDAFFRTSSGDILISNSLGSPPRPRSNFDPEAPDFWSGHESYFSGDFPQYFTPPNFTFHIDGFIQDNHLRRSQITARIHDDFNRSWLGTWGFGPWKGDIRLYQLEKLNFGLMSRDVSALALDDAGLWIGGKNRTEFSSRENDFAGLTYWDQIDETWDYFESRMISRFLSDEINDIEILGDWVLIATEFGINIYDKNKNNWYSITDTDNLNHEYVYDIALMDSIAYVATEGGLNAVDLDAWRRKEPAVSIVGGDDLKLQRVLQLDTIDNLLWAGTDYDIYVYDAVKDTGGFVRDVQAPLGDPITAVGTSKDEVWVGTTRGIYPYDVREKRWLDQPERNPNLDATVYKIVADEQAVWVGTDRGLYKLNRKERAWVHFTRQDGLAHNLVRELMLDGDYLWIGTPEGLTLFYWNDPSRID